MTRASRCSLAFALAASLAWLGASVARAGDPSRSSGDAHSARSRDVGDAPSASSRDPGEPVDEDAEPAEIAPGGDADAETMGSGGTSLGGSREPGAPESGSSWTPPPCEDVAAAPAPDPGDAKDSAAWRAALAEAQAKLEAAQTRLAASSGRYSSARHRVKPRGDALQDISKGRDDARAEYARARCALPALVERARRAGVSADVWRDYLGSE